MVFELLKNNAYVLVCGNSKWMPKEIEKAFKQVMGDYFNDFEKGEQFIEQMI